MDQEKAMRIARTTGKKLEKLVGSLSDFVDEALNEPASINDESRSHRDSNENVVVIDHSPATSSAEHTAPKKITHKITVSFPDGSKTDFYIKAYHVVSDAVKVMQQFLIAKMSVAYPDLKFVPTLCKDGTITIDDVASSRPDLSVRMQLHDVTDQDTQAINDFSQYVPYNPFNGNWPWGDDTSHDYLASLGYRNYRTDRKN